MVRETCQGRRLKVAKAAGGLEGSICELRGGGISECPSAVPWAASIMRTY